MAATGMAAISLLAGCAGDQGAGGAVEQAADRPASWTDLPVRTGARSVVYTDTEHRSYKVRIRVRSLVRGSEEDMRGHAWTRN
ncbi:hypothetical protein [Streptomyces tendae]|uniref:hypothetical protein n=1 Tax=Streptomyces tendae TaxID=1932 RepID=UPI002492E542|nr:hypothetical protein [Streptomyces tendae]